MLRNHATSTMTAVFLCFLNEVLSLNAQELALYNAMQTADKSSMKS